MPTCVVDLEINVRFIRLFVTIILTVKGSDHFSEITLELWFLPLNIAAEFDRGQPYIEQYTLTRSHTLRLLPLLDDLALK